MIWIYSRILGILGVITLVFSCPIEVCVCKWKNGKQTVECVERNLPNIPNGIDAGTQVLNFSGNGLQILHNERFLKMDLINIQKLYLSRNQLIRIHDRAFKGLSNLIELDLSDNMLTTIPSDSFQDYSSLMRLSLNGNPIREIKTAAFKHLSFLTTLEISNCQIDKIEDEAFIGMDNLEWLRIDGNRLTTIRGNHILPENLHGINLQGNRWACDCKLLDLHAWLNVNNVPHPQEPKCETPEKFYDIPIRTIAAEDLACLPIITPTVLYLEVAEGRNISLLCKISAVPEATISWWFQGNILQNDSLLTPYLHLWYYVEEGVEEKRSELFIYNSKAEDNGTFTCIAENPAGRTQANYTIRIIVKEEPIAEKINIGYDIFSLIIICTGCFSLLLLLIYCRIIIKRCRKSRNNQRNCEDDVTIQYQNNMTKCLPLSSNNHSSSSNPKPNSCVIVSEGNQQEMMLYITNSNADNGSGLSKQSKLFYNPASSKNFSDHNPDLINDAENVVDKTKYKKFDETNSNLPSSSKCHESINTAGLPQNINFEIYRHKADIHPYPGRFPYCENFRLDNEIITKTPIVQQTIPQSNIPHNYLTTLPRNKSLIPSKNFDLARQSDSEFFNKIQAYDLRVTSKALPRECPVNLPYNNMLQQVNCYPNAYRDPVWPIYLQPAYQPVPLSELNSFTIPQYNFVYSSALASATVAKRCVGAQTFDLEKENNEIINKPTQENNQENEEGNSSKNLSRPLADSPDEGYVGECQEGSDI